MGSPVMDVDCGARLPEHAATDGITGEDASAVVVGCRRTAAPDQPMLSGL
ncbi:hypothetical protein [Catenulispora pinisilvae]|nr:hypothetical protein [Catenulispora pinisilvae]